MDRSTRNLSIITLVVLVIFLALNNIARRSALIDWWTVLFFLLLAVGIWFYDRVSRREVDDSEASDAAVIEPLIYDHAAAPIGIPDTIELVAPNPGTVIYTTPHAPVIESAPPAPAPVKPIIEEKVAPPPPAPKPVAPPAPAPQAAASVAAPAPVVSKPVAPPKAAAPVVGAAPAKAKEAKPAKPASRGKGKAAASSEAPATPAKPDDLKVIEGIGPKMEKALNAAGITTFVQLAASSEDQINAAIVAAGMRFAPSVPTWAQQASFAAKGNLKGLEAFQKSLTGGRKAK